MHDEVDVQFRASFLGRNLRGRFALGDWLSTFRAGLLNL